MKSPISILTWLCLLFLASCISNKKTSLEAFKQDVYTPEYATGFKIMGADNTASTLIQVSNPWQGAKDVKMSYFISRNGEQAPAGFTGPTIPAGAKRIVCMASSYIAMFDAPQAEKARQIVARAEPDIDNAIAAVRDDRAFPPSRRKFYDRFMSGPVNPIFYSCFVKATAFTAGETCTGCGQCVRRCPTNNITLQTGKPVWGQDCTHCMACICYCPAEAIEYGKKSLGKPRYHFEAL